MVNTKQYMKIWETIHNIETVLTVYVLNYYVKEQRKGANHPIYTKLTVYYCDVSHKVTGK